MQRIAFAITMALASCPASARADNELPKDVREAFNKATEFECYSLDPSRVLKKNDKDMYFHNWKVLGKTTLKGDDAKKVRAAIDKGRKNSDGSVALCFNPRHGVRILHGKKTYDLLICYECHSAMIFEGDQKIGEFLTAPGPEKSLNKVLQAANVPLPKQRD